MLVQTKSCAWATSVLNRAAGYHPTREAAPPLALAEEATAVLRTRGLWDYAEARLAGGHPLPMMATGGDPTVFETDFQFSAGHDVDRWWGGVVSGKPVSAGVMSDAFVQRAGGEPGVVLAQHLRVDTPMVAAESRVRIVQTATWQPIIPRAVLRGDNALIEIVGGGACHRETIRRSGWRIVGGWKVAGGTTRIADRAGAAAQKADLQLREQKPAI